MIQPIQFLWRQLNGPQITAITQAIYHWIKNMFDDILDYFKDFRISSATFEHLQTIGVLNSFPLPILIKYKQQFFFFTYEKEVDAEKGFSSLVDRSVGGKFSSMEEHTAEETYLDAETYRELLQTVISCDCRPGSLRYLDKICKKIKDLDGTPSANYRYIYDDRNPGSITVDIGQDESWSDAASVKAVIDALAGSTYYPEPVLMTKISVEQQQMVVRDRKVRTANRTLYVINPDLLTAMQGYEDKEWNFILYVFDPEDTGELTSIQDPWNRVVASVPGRMVSDHTKTGQEVLAGQWIAIHYSKKLEEGEGQEDYLSAVALYRVPQSGILKRWETTPPDMTSYSGWFTAGQTLFEIVPYSQVEISEEYPYVSNGALTRNGGDIDSYLMYGKQIKLREGDVISVCDGQEFSPWAPLTITDEGYESYLCVLPPEGDESNYDHELGAWTGAPYKFRIVKFLSDLDNPNRPEPLQFQVYSNDVLHPKNNTGPYGSWSIGRTHNRLYAQTRVQLRFGEWLCPNDSWIEAGTEILDFYRSDTKERVLLVAGEGLYISNQQEWYRGDKLSTTEMNNFCDVANSRPITVEEIEGLVTYQESWSGHYDIYYSEDAPSDALFISYHIENGDTVTVGQNMMTLRISPTQEVILKAPVSGTFSGLAPLEVTRGSRIAEISVI